MAKANSKDSKPNKHESIHGDPSGESALQGIQFFNISNETSDLGHREELEADKNIPTETILPPPVSLPLPLNSLNSKRTCEDNFNDKFDVSLSLNDNVK